MKIVNYLSFALITLGLVACSNDDDALNNNEPSSVNISLAIGGQEDLRYSAPVDSLTKESINVSSVLINIVDGTGTVVATKTITKSTDLNSDWYNLTTPGLGLKFINIPQSISSVYVYGNPGTAVTGNAVSTTLDKQQGSAVLYYGMTSTLTPITPEPVEPNPTEGKTYNASVTIAPIVARMQISSISFEESGTTTFTRVINGQTQSATLNWTGFSGDLKGIYFNNFYYGYTALGNYNTLLQNTTFQSNILNGQWLFNNVSPAQNATAYASYSNYTTAYQNLPLYTKGKVYAFNFFPGTTIPTIHLDLANLKISSFTSSNTDVFNPSLFTNERFGNIVNYFKNGVTLMVPGDFVAGTIYNMDIKIIPVLDNDLGNVQFNILVHVTIAPWAEQTIVPGFNVNQ